MSSQSLAGMIEPGKSFLAPFTLLRVLHTRTMSFKVTEAALAPPREVGIRILNYLEDWLIPAHSRDLLHDHSHLEQKHFFSQYGVGLCQYDDMSRERVCTVGAELPVYKCPSTKLFQHVHPERAGACSLKLLNRTSTAVTYQLPRVAGGATRPVPVSTIASEQAHVGLSVHQFLYLH